MKTTRLLRNAYRILTKVNQHASSMRELSDLALQQKTQEFKRRLKQETLDDLLPEAYAAMREASVRVFGLFPYDEQILAAIILHQGHLADMKTGEGKSITAILALYLNALSGKGAILVTVNSYLAHRDGNQFAPVFEFMGLSFAIGVKLLPTTDFTVEEKQTLYQSDVLYTTSDKLGFDYLLENLATTLSDRFLRPFHYVIIDEADAILLDLAQMPLIISGAPRVQSNLYPLASTFVITQREDIDFEYDENEGHVNFTEAGIRSAESFYRIHHLYDPQYFRLNRHLNLALRAEQQLQPLKDYLVVNDEIRLLSSFTGRMLEGNKLHGGLHQAIEAKEGLPVTKENKAMASVTYQNLFSMFDKMAGMTGTAKGAEEELLRTYGTQVVSIPTHVPIIREDLSDVIVDTVLEKERLVIEYVKQIHETGRPILLTTSSVLNSSKLSQILLKEGISHNLLNAFSEAKEAEMIQEAGQKGAVTVATLMAGRGTDIKINEDVKQIGGLCIIVTEKMPSQRIDWQIRGRSGRLGSPGQSIFFASMQDDVYVKYGSIPQEELAKKNLSRQKKATHLRRAQLACEEISTRTRELAQEFDQAMIRQRDVIYQERERILKGEIIPDQKLEDMARNMIRRYFFEVKENHKDAILRFIFDHLSFHIPKSYEKLNHTDFHTVEQFLLTLFQEQRTRVSRLLKEEMVYQRFRSLIFLKAMDEAWIEQVDFLEQLKTVVSSRNVAQHRVEFEYRREAYHAFEDMRRSIEKEVVRLLCLSEIEWNEQGELVVHFA